MLLLEHKGFSDKVEYILSCRLKSQKDSRRSDCQHSPGELYISPQHMKLEGFLEDQEDNNRQVCEFQLCRVHFLRIWCSDRDSHTLLTHMLCPRGSRCPLDIHLGNHRVYISYFEWKLLQSESYVHSIFQPTCKTFSGGVATPSTWTSANCTVALCFTFCILSTRTAIKARIYTLVLIASFVVRTFWVMVAFTFFN